MKRFKVEVSEPVLQQIFEQVLFISDDSVSNALAWETRLLTALERLSEIHGHAVDEDATEQLGRRA